MSEKDPSQSKNALPAGYQLHWYTIKDILGHGGFGITYLAYDQNLAHEVAIKEYMPIELSMRDSEDHSVHPLSDRKKSRYEWGLERFISEARTIGRFKHANIIRVRNVFEDNNTAYMVMDYEVGESLQDILTRKKILNQDELMSMIFPIIEGVKSIHASGFIHRDIKPANIFIRTGGEPVLLDFGSARKAVSKHKRTITSLFSKGYAPIEQYESSDDNDTQGPWTDIYSLGATMYRCISGMAPTDAIDRSSAIIHTGQDTYVSAIEIGEGRYSKSLLEAIDFAMNFKRDERPIDIAEWEIGLHNLVPPMGDITIQNSILEVENKNRFMTAKKAATEGDVKAQAELAYYYVRGVGTEKDDSMAFNWYFNAAQQNNINSQYNLGVMYAKGRGVKQNFAEAFRWYKRAAEQGDPAAQATIAMMCEKGIGTDKNIQDAINYYSLAAEQGNVNAQYTLGTWFAKGTGVEKDYPKAFSWFQKAAEQGHINAQLNLGYFYGKGKGVERDDRKAFEWFEKAAEQGNSNAQYNLGVIYSRGRGIEVDLSKSREWYQKAADQGDDGAKLALKKLPPDE